MASGGISFTIDAHQANVLSTRMHAAARDFPPALKQTMKKSATEIEKSERAAALQLPSTGVYHTGLRREISNAVTLKDISNTRQVGFSVYVEESRVRGRIAADTNRNRGWRHPVFGDRLQWVQQIMSPGWWDTAARPGAQHATTNVRALARDLARKITKG